MQWKAWGTCPLMIWDWGASPVLLPGRVALYAALNTLAQASRNCQITQLESAARPQLTTEMHEIQAIGHSLAETPRHRTPWVQSAQLSEQNKDLCRQPRGEHRTIMPTQECRVVIYLLGHDAHGKTCSPALGFVRR